MNMSNIDTLISSTSPGVYLDRKQERGPWWTVPSDRRHHEPPRLVVVQLRLQLDRYEGSPEKNLISHAMNRPTAISAAKVLMVSMMTCHQDRFSRSLSIGHLPCARLRHPEWAPIGSRAADRAAAEELAINIPEPSTVSHCRQSPAPYK